MGLNEISKFNSDQSPYSLCVDFESLSDVDLNLVKSYKIYQNVKWKSQADFQEDLAKKYTFLEFKFGGLGVKNFFIVLADLPEYTIKNFFYGWKYLTKKDLVNIVREVNSCDSHGESVGSGG